MILKFGKFKGQKLEQTPEWYQKWLNEQEWFKAKKDSNTTKSLHEQLSGWDGHSKKGEAIYDAIFEQEKAESNAMYCDCGNMKSPEKRSCGTGCFEYPEDFH